MCTSRKLQVAKTISLALGYVSLTRLRTPENVSVLYRQDHYTSEVNEFVYQASTTDENSELKQVKFLSTRTSYFRGSTELKAVFCHFVGFDSTFAMFQNFARYMPHLQHLYTVQ